MPHTYSRRKWLAQSAGAAAAFSLPKGLLASLHRTPSAKGFVADKVPSKLQPFPLTDVHLRPGVFRQAAEANYSFLDSLPNDRLLHMFRVTAGIPSSAEPLGGWEEPNANSVATLRAATCSRLALFTFPRPAMTRFG